VVKECTIALHHFLFLCILFRVLENINRLDNFKYEFFEAMKKLNFYIFFTFFTSFLFSQNHDKAISYNYKFWYRENTEEKHRMSEMLLISNGKTKYYLPKDKMSKISDIKDEPYFTRGADGHITITRRTSNTKHFIVKNIQSKELFEIIDSEEDHYYKADNEIINWIIEDSITQFKKLDISVQKATTKYRGRNYIAFFAPQIPINLGPFKFDGLPGLLVNLKDSESNYIFELTSLSSELVNEKLYDPTQILERLVQLKEQEFAVSKYNTVKKLFAADKKFYEANYINGEQIKLKLKLQSDLMMEIDEK
jgi:GLPGLI family protein